jgi:DNA-binding transcriptional ArsR family regulator/uncharacterized protein YndB with AHSA1/START domain
MDEVFRAVSDPNRRLLLDALFREDGQTLRSLHEHLDHMTRQGVMSHLAVLEEAGLVTTRRVGREKHHYLNPVPIRLIHDRWIGKYRETTTATIVAVKTTTEGGGTMNRPAHVYVAHIRGPATAVWEAITDGDKTVQYYYGTRVESTWEPGAAVRYTYPDGSLVADGEVIAIEAHRRLEMTFHAHWDEQLDQEGPVREVWLLDEQDGITVLTVETWDMEPGSKTYEDFTGGLPHIISGLKTLVETGRPLVARS